MSGQTTLSFWQLLTFSLLPATLTAIVALVGPMLLEKRKQVAEAKKRRLEKLEELVQALYEYNNWVEERKRGYLFGKPRPDGVDPSSKAQAIVRTYFPPLRARVANLQGTVRRLLIWSIDAQKAANGDLGLYMKQEHVDAHNTVYNPYWGEFLALLGDVSKLSDAELTQVTAPWHYALPKWFSKR